MDTGLLTRRGDYLQALLDEPRTKAELEVELGDSRSTVNRAMVELSDAGLVEEFQGECRLTLSGRLAAQTVRRFRRHARGVEAGTELFAGLDPELDVGLDITTGAAVHPARGSRPYRAFHAFERLVEEATAFRGSASMFANPRGGELFEEAIVERGIPVEFYLAEPLFAAMRADFADAFERWVATGSFSGFVVPDCPNYTTLVSELPDGPHSGIALYSCDGEFHGVLVNDSRRALRWAEDTLDAVAADATPFEAVL